MKIHKRIGWLTLVTLAFSSGAWAAEPEAVPGEYLVKLKPSITKRNLQRSDFLPTLSRALGSSIKSTIADDNVVIVKRSLVETPSAAIQALTANSMVELAEPNFIYRAEKNPNDPLFEKLWGLSNFGQSDNRGVGVAGVDIDAVRAWDISQGSEDVVIAVIDTGIDYNHPDLKDNMWTNLAEANGQPGVDDDGNGFIDDIHGISAVDPKAPTGNPLDDHGHGSHCSGTIGARGDDSKGIVGVNWRVKLMAVKFLSADGGGTLEGAIVAIDYATKMGAKIMSNSWGGGGESQLLKEAIQRAHAAGALFVAAAGNNSGNNDTTPHFPSNYDVPNVLSVAAIDNKGQLASFSNFGKKTTHVAAPGVNIYSSVINGKYSSYSGTSMATPHVSGVAGLLAANEPGLTNVELKKRIMSTVRPLTTIKNKVSSGGMVNAYFALTNQVAPPDANDPSTWESKPVTVSSAHPYLKNTSAAFEVQADGAKEVAVYFSRFDTESGYDKVFFVNRAGTIVGEMSGTNDDTYSPIISGDYVKIIFTSDNSTNNYGFDITKVAFR